jgi:hypothetical protein
MRITQLQFERLHQARRVDGMSVQEHIRRALDLYLEKLERVNSQYRAAVEARPGAPAGDAASDAVRTGLPSEGSDPGVGALTSANDLVAARPRVRAR